MTADLGEYPDAYLQCRDLRHHWKILGYYRSDGGYKRRLQCSNCPTTAIDTIRGWVTKRTYSYPENYHLTGRVKVAEIRVEAIDRAAVYESEEDYEAEITSTGRRRRKRGG